MKRTLNAFAVSVLVTAVLASCSNYRSPGGQQGRSGLKFRAFVSNPLHVTTGGVTLPVLEIVDASKDVQSAFAVSLSGALPDAGMMVLSPKKDKTLVVSPSSNRFAIVDNATESASSSIGLPGATESLFVWTDNTTVFVAVPRATILGQAAGGVGRIDTSTGAVTATIPIPGAHYLVPSPSGNQVLIFSDNSDAVTLLFPSLIGSGNPLSTVVSGSLDKPVWGVFNTSGSTAYIFSCGKECGGTTDASIVPLDLGTQTTGTPIPLVNGSVMGGATIGLLSGNTLFVAGTPPGTACGSGTLAQNCGVLSVVDLGSSSVTAAVLIPDGYHNRIQMGANGQLFVGSHNCTNVTTASEVRGCLAIFDAVQSKVTVPPQTGDVTGIEPISNRNQVYVCQGGALRIYDTTTDKVQTTQVNIVGQAIDVKVVDF